MSTVSVRPPRIGRSYTRARRHPWVLGKIGDWTLPLGPYTPAQLVIAFVGVLTLIQTFTWWSFLGPLPIAAVIAAVWAVRSARIGGRVPAAALWGLVGFALQPTAGRIHGRSARDRRPALLGGGFHMTVSDVAQNAPMVPVPLRTPVAQPRPASVRSAVGPIPVRTALQQLLADRQQPHG